ncbi:MAG: hypothetical protein DLM53_07450 [Candidatus Eremiobacter antarcticus]|nr:transposase [Candidatus Eremiobacteraeota bacterium]MBC5807213.1 transposase [Candidatus Eremiobacteraeota bacterium]PZR61895.1 MAG: hypothetical protein DLM53_07450 [Candidatus Eremiobacter sp. RRmetagenome_bin22]
MRKSRFTEPQIVGILKEFEAGVAIAELARRHGIHANTIHHWKAKYAGMSVSDVARIKQLEDENGRLRRVVANLTLDVDALKYALSKNYDGPRSERRR